MSGKLCRTQLLADNQKALPQPEFPTRTTPQMSLKTLEECQNEGGRYCSSFSILTDIGCEMHPLDQGKEFYAAVTMLDERKGRYKMVPQGLEGYEGEQEG